MAASSLLQRVITASILIPTVVIAVLYLPTTYLSICFALIALLGGWEWGSFAGISTTSGKLSYVIVLGLALLAWYFLLAYPILIEWFLLFSFIWWCAVTVYILRCKRIDQAGPGLNLLRAAIGLFVLLQLWLSLVLLHGSGDDGPLLVLFLLILIWVADSGAYFAGHRWGNRKLAPVVSPGKSWEGVYGALVGAVLCGLFLSFFMNEREYSILLIPVCVLTVLMSVVGDLFESMFKRQVAMKDSGTILPGHGGVLDRIDSLTAAAPVFLVGLSYTTGF